MDDRSRLLCGRGAEDVAGLHAGRESPQNFATTQFAIFSGRSAGVPLVRIAEEIMRERGIDWPGI
jgi:hypothetical protein